MKREAKIAGWAHIATAFALSLCCIGIYALRQGGAPAEAAPAAVVEVHFSPAENLENLDLWYLDQAQRTVDVASYAMDDKPIAEELVKLADRGVAIRIYRDQTQYEGEVARGKKGGANLTDLFAGHKNIQVRVKGSVALQHLKSYAVDDKFLREGSANWSVQGEKVQDNSLVVIWDQAAILAFERDFGTMWDRAGNQVVQ